MKRSVFAVVAVVICALWATPSHAGIVILHADIPPSCLDTPGDPLINCFQDGGAGGSCQQNINSCFQSCSATEVSELTRCAALQDPVGRANCTAIAQVNNAVCNNACASMPPCP